MGRGWRIAAPRSAKQARRAVTRPGKTARQAVTPRTVKKAARTSWRVAHPTTGVRQEVEGRGIAQARRGLFGRSRSEGAGAAVMPDFRESIAQLKRDGWRPESINLQLVPVLRDCSQFHAIELERVAALRAVETAQGAEAELGSMLLVCWAYSAQLDLVAQLMQLIVEEDDPLDESYLRFWAWSEWWRGVTEPEAARWIARGKVLEAQTGAETLQAATMGVSRYIDAFTKRTVPKSAR